MDDYKLDRPLTIPSSLLRNQTPISVQMRLHTQTHYRVMAKLGFNVEAILKGERSV